MKSMSSPKKYGDPMGPPWPTHSFHPSLFPHAKKAGARKSSPAKEKRKGCSCEGGSVHRCTSRQMFGDIINPPFQKINRQFVQPFLRG